MSSSPHVDSIVGPEMDSPDSDMRNSGDSETTALSSPLTWRTSFLFPLQSRMSRREIHIGAMWLLVPFFGWIVNMGHRIQFVHNMMHDEPPFPAWGNYRQLFRHGMVTFLGMVYYYIPAAILAAVYFTTQSLTALAAGIICFLVATAAIPGYMSHYCREFDVREVFNPILAFSRVAAAGLLYWKAWAVALSALALSFLGLLALGVGFLYTSVWFWQVAGFSFATVMTRTHFLSQHDESPTVSFGRYN